MMTLDSLRSRFLYKSLDAAMTAALRPKKKFMAHVQSIINPRVSNYDRVATLVNLVDTVLPGTARRTQYLLHRPDHLPFKDVRIELFDYGSGTTVFLMQMKDVDRVLKIYRRTLGKNPEDLLNLAKWYRQKYETVSSWYSGSNMGSNKIVTEVNYLILNGPMIGRSAVACVQRYIAEEKRDLFRNFSDDELINIMKDHEALKAQFMFFATRTLHIYSTLQSCVDLLGEGNLVIVKCGDMLKLQLLDFGIFDLNALERNLPPVFAQVQECIARLKSLLERLSTSS